MIFPKKSNIVSRCILLIYIIFLSHTFFPHRHQIHNNHYDILHFTNNQEDLSQHEHCTSGSLFGQNNIQQWLEIFLSIITSIPHNLDQEVMGFHIAFGFIFLILFLFYLASSKSLSGIFKFFIHDIFVHFNQLSGFKPSSFYFYNFALRAPPVV